MGSEMCIRDSLHTVHDPFILVANERNMINTINTKIIILNTYRVRRSVLASRFLPEKTSSRRYHSECSFPVLPLLLLFLMLLMLLVLLLQI